VADAWKGIVWNRPAPLGSDTAAPPAFFLLMFEVRWDFDGWVWGEFGEGLDPSWSWSLELEVPFVGSGDWGGSI